MKDKPSFPARLAGWEYQYERAEKAEALAADRLEMNKELEAASLKVLRTSLGRKELLRRGIKPMNSAEYKIWVEDVAEELGDE